MKRASALALLVSCGVVVAACNAIFGLEEGVADVGACSDNLACDDANPCTVNQCLQGSCVSIGGPNVVVPNSEQTAGDCQRAECDANGELELVIDDEDVPDDDNDCTVDECRSGDVFATPVDFGSRCNNGNGFCDAEGNCGDCITESDCPAANFCVSFACEMGQCTPTFTAMGTALPTDVAGDCQQEVCDGGGQTISMDDASDLPIDGNECTVDQCTGGPLAPDNSPVADATGCGSGGSTECQSGVCVGCMNDGECTADSFCSDWSCNIGNQQCQVNYTAIDTPLDSGQTLGDCKVLVCNGMGGISTNNESDPFDDSNECTSDTCSQGARIHTDLPLDTDCGPNNMQFCDSVGMCVECNSAPQCPPGANECQIAVCASSMCTFNDQPNGFPLAMQVSGDCQTAVCDGSGGFGSQVENSDEPLDDGNSCTDDTCSAGIPVHPDLTGPACSGGFCSSGLCVECYDNIHCPTRGECCDFGSNTCVTSGCTMSS